VTAQQLTDALAQYKAGLEAARELLRRLDVLAASQRSHTEARDYAGLAADGDRREDLMRALVALEPGLTEVRTALSRIDERRLAGRRDYEAVTALRASARELVARTLATDEASLQSLSDAELARRAALSSLEAGEHTLVAYRRVLAPPLAHASLLDRRG
jgi:hypothetical protein